MNDLRQSTAHMLHRRRRESENEYIIKILMTTIALIDISGGIRTTESRRKQWRSSHFV